MAAASDRRAQARASRWGARRALFDETVAIRTNRVGRTIAIEGKASCQYILRIACLVRQFSEIGNGALEALLQLPARRPFQGLLGTGDVRLTLPWIVGGQRAKLDPR